MIAVELPIVTSTRLTPVRYTLIFTSIKLPRDMVHFPTFNTRYLGRSCSCNHSISSVQHVIQDWTKWTRVRKQCFKAKWRNDKLKGCLRIILWQYVLGLLSSRSCRIWWRFSIFSVCSRILYLRFLIKIWSSVFDVCVMICFAVLYWCCVMLV